MSASSGALVFDEQGRLLLHKRADNGFWGIPGGYMELGETVQETTRREVWEETGLHLGQLTLFAVYSGAEYEGTLPNGHQLANVMFVFTCRDYSGELQKVTEESMEIRFFPLDALPDNLFPGQSHVFRDLRSGKQVPIIS